MTSRSIWLLPALAWRLLAACGPAHAWGPFGPETRKQGYVWREAGGPNDQGDRTDILALGKNLAPDLSETPGLDVLMNEPETVVGSTSSSVTIDRPAIATPALSEASGGGTFAQAGNAYTLDLGTAAFGAATTAVFSLANAAASPANSFEGLFSTPTGSGFTVAGASLPQALAAGATARPPPPRSSAPRSRGNASRAPRRSSAWRHRRVRARQATSRPPAPGRPPPGPRRR